VVETTNVTIEYDQDSLTENTNCFVNVDDLYTYDLSKFVD